MINGESVNWEENQGQPEKDNIGWQMGSNVGVSHGQAGGRPNEAGLRQKVDPLMKYMQFQRKLAGGRKENTGQAAGGLSFDL